MRQPGNVTVTNSRELIEIDLILVLTALYLCVNGIAACAFAWDKCKARKNTWRTSENALLVLAFMGPFGAFGAMRLFRHKTLKIKFYLVPVFAVLHVIAIIWLLSTLIR